MLIRMSWTSLRGITNVEMKFETKMIKSQPNDIYICACVCVCASTNSICTVCLCTVHSTHETQSATKSLCSFIVKYIVLAVFRRGYSFVCLFICLFTCLLYAIPSRNIQRLMFVHNKYTHLTGNNYTILRMCFVSKCEIISFIASEQHSNTTDKAHRESQWSDLNYMTLPLMRQCVDTTYTYFTFPRYSTTPLLLRHHYPTIRSLTATKYIIHKSMHSTHTQLQYIRLISEILYTHL